MADTEVMAKNHQHYPQFPFELCLDMAKRVFEFGGEVHSDRLAESMRRANSGAFRILINASVKHGLLAYSNYVVYLSMLGRAILTASDAITRHKLEIEAFLSPPIYKSVYENWGEISENNLEQYFQKVGVDKAHLVKRNFLMGARSLGLLNRNILNTPIIDNINYQHEELFDEEKSVDEVDTHRSSSENISETTPTESDEIDEAIKGQEIKQPIEPNNLVLEKMEEPIKSTSGHEKERVSVQTLLTGARVAELSVPRDLSIKDYEILKAWLDVLKMSLAQ